MLLEIKRVEKKYPKFHLHDISFSLPEGCIMGLIGENGAGKSTTINAILDLIKIDSGEIIFWGKRLSDDFTLKEDIGVVFDEINFATHLTAEDVEKILRATYKKWDKTLFYDYLDKFVIERGKKIKELSKGQKTKLSIACALSHKPKLLILDEATSGLDPIIRDDILDVFLEFVENEKHSILMSSHITGDLERIADYITFIHKGELIFVKNKDELRYKYGIMKVGRDYLSKIDKEDMVALRHEEYQTSVLVSNKEEAKKKYPGAVIDDATIDDILLIYVKGERIK